jgi:hypothetical protein
MTENKYENVSLFIASPCYGDKVTVPYMRSILDLLKLLRQKGIRYMHYTLSTDSLVTRARNSCVAAFLSQPGFTHMIFIDVDIAFTASSIFKLLDADKDIVGGIYPKKKLDMRKLIHALENNVSDPETVSSDYVVSMENKQQHIVSNGLLEVDEIGTGFLMIKRSVFERIISKEGDSIKYIPLMTTVAQSPGNFYAFFHTDIDPVTNHYLSEDYWFIKKFIRDYGGKVYADINISLTHCGIMKFDGSFRTILSGT